ncbi:MAG: Ppx/GppA family phosphatase [Arcobacteraceae bacterium]|nr:Ppx/GppA family phosphatase [Arcobacteraceae bacterium]
MAKITTIIDIGSNSMRMVVLKKTSRFGFHLINETKSKVKISQNCYENNGNLQNEPMQRAFNALESFLSIAKNLKSRKILCVATSALRDAPNSKEFLTKVQKELKLSIKVIDGEKEAYLGAVAATNLLSNKDFITVDIGGGSTEFTLVEDKNIKHTISLKMGTVRLQELYFVKNDFEGAEKYILEQLTLLNPDFKNIKSVVGLGGTARALSKLIIDSTNYPLDVLHGFTYKVEDNKKLFKDIINCDTNEQLKVLGVRKDRYDTIKIGTFIFNTILEYLGIQTVVTSGVGVREGLYLTDILRTSNHKFPANFNVSVRSLLDRFTTDYKQTAYLGNNISKLFDILQPLHKLDKKYKSYLVISAKLQQIGVTLNFYKNSTHSANFILNGLHYGFTHQERILIATIIKYSKNELPKENNIKNFKELLPDIKIIQWLSYIHSLNKILNSEFLRNNFKYQLENNQFTISSFKEHYIIQRGLKKLKKPFEFELILLKGAI